MTEQEHADRVKSAAQALNAAMAEATMAGKLKVEIEILEQRQLGIHHAWPTLTVTVSKPL